MVQKIDIKKILQNKQKLVEIQIINYALLNDIFLIKSHLEVAAFIAINGYDKTTLKKIVEKGIFKDEQCVRNCRRDLVNNKILTEPKKRVFEINPEIGITNTDTLYTLKLLYASKD